MNTQFIILTDKGYYKGELHCITNFTNNKEDARRFNSKFDAQNKVQFLSAFLRFKSYPTIDTAL